MTKYRKKVFAMYKGEEILAIGSIEEIAEELNMKVDSVRWYLAPCYKRLLAKRKNGNQDKQRILVEIDEE